MYFILCICDHISICNCKCPQNVEGARSPGAGDTSGCKQPTLGAGNQN